MITQLYGPFTFEAKMSAVQKEVRAAFEKYLKNYNEKRIWSAEKMPERGEMGYRVDRLSPASIIILKGVTKTEVHEPDYVDEAMRASGPYPVFAEYYDNWGYQERQHWMALIFSLVDSGLMTAKAAQELIAETMKETWTFLAQTGLKFSAIWSTLWAAVYAMLQEDETRIIYGNTRLKFWREMGSEMNGHQRVFRGIPRTLIRLMIDEGRHRDIFAEIVLIWMKYFPAQVLHAVKWIYRHYKMPVINLGKEFSDTVIEHRLDSPSIIKKILRKSRAELGIESGSALVRALKGLRQLPKDAILQLPETQTSRRQSSVLNISGAPIYLLQPNGEFELEHGIAA